MRAGSSACRACDVPVGCRASNLARQSASRSAMSDEMDITLGRAEAPLWPIELLKRTGIPAEDVFRQSLIVGDWWGRKRLPLPSEIVAAGRLPREVERSVGLAVDDWRAGKWMSHETRHGFLCSGTRALLVDGECRDDRRVANPL